MSELESESVSLSVWSPPYCVGKEYERDLRRPKINAEIVRFPLTLYP
jgi:hypothetical protein